MYARNHAHRLQLLPREERLVSRTTEMYRKTGICRQLLYGTASDPKSFQQAPRSNAMGADRQASLPSAFRFLDLPDDIRLMVYDQLLLPAATFRTLHPPILATCKTVHAQATYILYKYKVITISPDRDGARLHVANSLTTRWLGMEDLDCDLLTGVIFPQNAHLIVEVSLPDTELGNPRTSTRKMARAQLQINHALYILAKELHHSGSTVTSIDLRLHIGNQSVGSVSEIAGPLWSMSPRNVLIHASGANAEMFTFLRDRFSRLSSEHGIEAVRSRMVHDYVTLCAVRVRLEHMAHEERPWWKWKLDFGSNSYSKRLKLGPSEFFPGVQLTVSDIQALSNVVYLVLYVTELRALAHTAGWSMLQRAKDAVDEAARRVVDRALY